MNKKILALALVAVVSATAAEAKEAAKTAPVKISKPAAAKSSNTTNVNGKTYVRLDTGYGFTKFKKGTFHENAKANTISGGLGYSFTDSVRAELQLYHSFGAEADKAVTGGKEKYELKTTALFANAFYDFKNSSMFTPYVMAGLGVANNELKGSKPNVRYSSKDTNNLALQAGAGVATKIADNVVFDVRYNTMDKGARYKFIDNSATLKTGIEHSAMAGIRFHF